MKRNKSNIKVHYGLPDFFKYYLENCEHEKVSKSKFKEVIESCNIAISDKIMEGEEFKFPAIRFNLSIVKKKHTIKLDKEGNPVIKWLPLDYKATKALWLKTYPDKTLEEILEIPDRPRVYQRNKHTAGYIYKWYLNKFSGNFVNKTVYSFEPTRHNKRKLSSIIKSEDFKDVFYEY